MLQAIIASFSQPGSGFMWAITAALALGLAVGLDRVWYLYLRLRVDERVVAERRVVRQQLELQLGQVAAHGVRRGGRFSEDHRCLPGSG